MSLWLYQVAVTMVWGLWLGREWNYIEISTRLTEYVTCEVDHEISIWNFSPQQIDDFVNQLNNQFTNILYGRGKCSEANLVVERGVVVSEIQLILSLCLMSDN